MNSKKTGLNLVVAVLIVVFAVANLILFLTVDSARLESAVFWIAWVFTFPVNLVAVVLARIWCGKKGGMALVQIPVAYYIVLGFMLVYWLIGFRFMYLPIESVTLIIVIEAAVTGVYIVVAMYGMFAASHIMQSEREVKEKVAYISALRADIDDILMKVTDPAVKNALLELSESVRYSDPMSHPSLGGVEAEISVLIARISALVSTGDSSGAVVAVSEAKNLVEARNRRCIMLK